MKILLDGKETAAYIIDPTKHKFIGAFRRPNPYSPVICDVIPCDCGQSLWTRNAEYDHWLLGHFDILQYQSIKETNE